MKSPHRLKVTRKAEDLAVLAYRVTTKFPTEERYGLTGQIRRAAVSVGSNIAEGCGRAGDRDLARFTQYAYGSAGEMEFQLRLALRLGFGREPEVHALQAATEEVKRMLARLIVRLRTSGVGLRMSDVGPAAVGVPVPPAPTSE